jgi:hypothetical protein
MKDAFSVLVFKSKRVAHADRTLSLAWGILQVSLEGFRLFQQASSVNDRGSRRLHGSNTHA